MCLKDIENMMLNKVIRWLSNWILYLFFHMKQEIKEKSCIALNYLINYLYSQISIYISKMLD